jgi:mannose/fructose/N-acetylgalactosamine-specific phosphotransferase system component IIC
LNGWVLIIRPIHPAAAAITIAIPIAVAVAITITITITSSTWASRGRKFQNGNVYSL